jgi:hypothetical protein
MKSISEENLLTSAEINKTDKENLACGKEDLVCTKLQRKCKP